MTAKDLEKPPRRPGGRGAANAPWVRIGPFWLEGGPLDPVDAAQMDAATKQRRCEVVCVFVGMSHGRTARCTPVSGLDSIFRAWDNAMVCTKSAKMMASLCRTQVSRDDSRAERVSYANCSSGRAAGYQCKSKILPGVLLFCAGSFAMDLGGFVVCQVCLQLHKFLKQ